MKKKCGNCHGTGLVCSIQQIEYAPIRAEIYPCPICIGKGYILTVKKQKDKK